MDNQVWTGCAGRRRANANSASSSAGHIGNKSRTTLSASSVSSKNLGSVKRINANSVGGGGSSAAKKRLLRIGSFLPQGFLQTAPAAAVAAAATEAKQLKSKRKNEIEMTANGKAPARTLTVAGKETTAVVEEVVSS
jgi:hypothetical protein